jgi:excisionase family DNA binding protein/PAS domain S-box-containing protein
MEKREKRLLTIKELAAYLQVNQTTIYRLVRRSEIPAFKVGGDWRFNTESIDAWLSGDARSIGRPLPEMRQLTPARVPVESPGRVREQVALLSVMDAEDLPTADLVRLTQTISELIAPIVELQATIPIIKRIAHALEDRRDASGEIARLYGEQAIPLRTHSGNLLEFAPIPFGVVNRERRLVSFNDAYCRLFGFSPKQMRTVVLTDLVYEADLERFIAINRQLLTGQAKSGEFVGRRFTAEGPPILTRSRAWVVHKQTSAKPEYAAAVLERIATKDEASALFARCADRLSKRRASFLACRATIRTF